MANLEKGDALQEVSTTINEWFAPYYSETFSPGEVKEQFEVGLQVKTPPENRTNVRTGFIAVATPEKIGFETKSRAVRLQVNFSAGWFVGYNDITVNTQDWTWSWVHFARNAGVIQCDFVSGDIPSQALSGIDFIRCVDTWGGGIQVGRLDAITDGDMTISWTTTVGLTYNITYIL